MLIEGHRPGVMERLGLGPDACPERLIHGRMTGWGQDSSWDARAGHDLTYLAMTGELGFSEAQIEGLAKKGALREAGTP